MNRIYKKIFNAVRGMMVVVDEAKTGHSQAVKSSEGVVSAQPSSARCSWKLTCLAAAVVMAMSSAESFATTVTAGTTLGGEITYRPADSSLVFSGGTYSTPAVVEALAFNLSGISVSATSGTYNVLRMTTNGPVDLSGSSVTISGTNTYFWIENLTYGARVGNVKLANGSVGSGSRFKARETEFSGGSFSISGNLDTVWATITSGTVSVNNGGALYGQVEMNGGALNLSGSLYASSAISLNGGSLNLRGGTLYAGGYDYYSPAAQGQMQSPGYTGTLTVNFSGGNISGYGRVRTSGFSGSGTVEATGGTLALEIDNITATLASHTPVWGTATAPTISNVKVAAGATMIVCTGENCSTPNLGLTVSTSATVKGNGSLKTTDFKSTGRLYLNSDLSWGQTAMSTINASGSFTTSGSMVLGNDPNWTYSNPSDLIDIYSTETTYNFISTSLTVNPDAWLRLYGYGGGRAGANFSGTSVKGRISASNIDFWGNTSTGVLGSIDASGSLSVTGNLTNAGTSKGTSVSVSGALSNTSGSTEATSGTLSAASLSNTGGTISSTGNMTVTGTVINSGTVKSTLGSLSAGNIYANTGTISSLATITVDTGVTNSGILSSGTSLTVKAGGLTNNSGGSVTGTSVSVTGDIQNNGTLTSGIVTATGSVSNSSKLTATTSLIVGKDLTTTAGSEITAGEISGLGEGDKLTNNGVIKLTGSTSFNLNGATYTGTGSIKDNSNNVISLTGGTVTVNYDATGSKNNIGSGNKVNVVTGGTIDTVSNANTSYTLEGGKLKVSLATLFGSDASAYETSDTTMAVSTFAAYDSSSGGKTSVTVASYQEQGVKVGLTESAAINSTVKELLIFNSGLIEITDTNVSDTLAADLAAVLADLKATDSKGDIKVAASDTASGTSRAVYLNPQIQENFDVTYLDTLTDKATDSRVDGLVFAGKELTNEVRANPAETTGGETRSKLVIDSDLTSTTQVNEDSTANVLHGSFGVKGIRNTESVEITDDAKLVLVGASTSEGTADTGYELLKNYASTGSITVTKGSLVLGLEDGNATGGHLHAVNVAEGALLVGAINTGDNSKDSFVIDSLAFTDETKDTVLAVAKESAFTAKALTDTAKTTVAVKEGGELTVSSVTGGALKGSYTNEGKTEINSASTGTGITFEKAVANGSSEASEGSTAEFVFGSGVQSVTFANGLTNAENGKVYAKTDEVLSMTLSGATTNAGELGAQTALLKNVAVGADNADSATLTNTGKIWTKALAVNAVSEDSAVLTNSGVIGSSEKPVETFTIGGNTGDDTARVTNTGGIWVKGTETAGASSAKIAEKGELINSAKATTANPNAGLHVEGTLDVAGKLVNTGNVTASGSSKIAVTGILSNTSGAEIGSESTHLKALAVTGSGTVDNGGKIWLDDSLTLADSALLTNKSAIEDANGKNLAVTVGGTSSLVNEGTIHGVNSLTVTSTGSGSAAALQNKAGAEIGTSADRVTTLTVGTGSAAGSAAQLENQGRIWLKGESDGSLTVVQGGKLTNTAADEISGTARGTVDVQGALTVAGSLENNGDLVFKTPVTAGDDSTAVTGKITVTSTGSLANTGLIDFSSEKTNDAITAAGSFTNSATGEIRGLDSLAVSGAGSANAGEIGADADRLTNFTVGSSDSGTASGANPTLTNTGHIWVKGNGSAVKADGALVNSANGTGDAGLDIEGMLTVAGVLENTGKIRFADEKTGDTVTTAAELAVTGKGTVTNTGSVEGLRNLTVTATGGSGAQYTNKAGATTAAENIAVSGGTFVNEKSTDVSGALVSGVDTTGNITVTDGGVFVNRGEIASAYTGAEGETDKRTTKVTVGGGEVSAAGTLINTGLLHVKGESGTAVIINAGSKLSNEAYSGEAFDKNAGVVDLAGDLKNLGTFQQASGTFRGVENSGTFTLTGETDTTFAGAFQNSGTVNLGKGDVAVTGAITNAAGASFTTEGSLTASGVLTNGSGSEITAAAITVAGTGTESAKNSNTGSMKTNGGDMAVLGDMTSSGVIDLTDSTPGGTAGNLTVAGGATLAITGGSAKGGTLTLGATASGGSPASTGSLTVAKDATLTFTNFTAVAGGKLDNAADLTFSGLTGFDGDTDGDGKADFTYTDLGGSLKGEGGRVIALDNTVYQIAADKTDAANGTLENIGKKNHIEVITGGKAGFTSADTTADAGTFTLAGLTADGSTLEVKGGVLKTNLDSIFNESTEGIAGTTYPDADGKTGEVQTPFHAGEGVGAVKAGLNDTLTFTNGVISFTDTDWTLATVSAAQSELQKGLKPYDGSSGSGVGYPYTDGASTEAPNRYIEFAAREGGGDGTVPIYAGEVNAEINKDGGTATSDLGLILRSDTLNRGDKDTADVETLTVDKTETDRTATDTVIHDKLGFANVGKTDRLDLVNGTEMVLVGTTPTTNPDGSKTLANVLIDAPTSGDTNVDGTVTVTGGSHLRLGDFDDSEATQTGAKIGTVTVSGDDGSGKASQLTAQGGDVFEITNLTVGRDSSGKDAAGNLTVTQNASLTADRYIDSAKTKVTVTGEEGRLIIKSTDALSGVYSNEGTLEIDASTQADKSLSFGQKLENKGTTTVGDGVDKVDFEGGFANSGVIGKNVTTSDGTVVADAIDAVAVGADSTNTGTVYAKDVTVDAGKTLTNAGKFEKMALLDTTAAGSSAVNGEGGEMNFTDGVIRAGETGFTNEGKVTGLKTLTSTGDVVNEGADSVLDFTGSSVDTKDKTLTTDKALTNEGKITGVGTVTVKSGDSKNAGSVGQDQGDGTTTGWIEKLAVGDAASSGATDATFENTGKLYAKEIDIARGSALTNKDTVKSKTITGGEGSSLTNEGKIADITTVTTSGSVENEGSMSFTEDSGTAPATKPSLTLTGDKSSLINQEKGVITGLTDLNIGGTESTGSGKGSATNKGKITSENVTIAEGGSYTNSGKESELTAGTIDAGNGSSFTNEGKVKDLTTVTTSGTFTNEAGGSMTFTADGATDPTMTVTGTDGSFTNEGSVTGLKNLTVTEGAKGENAGDLTTDAVTVGDNSSFKNVKPGTVTTAKITGGDGSSLTNESTITGLTDIDTDGSLTNSGTLDFSGTPEGGKNTAMTVAGDFDNSGTVKGLDEMTLTGDKAKNTGAIGGEGDELTKVTIGLASPAKSTDFTNDAGGSITAGEIDIEKGSLTNRGSDNAGNPSTVTAGKITGGSDTAVKNEKDAVITGLEDLETGTLTNDGKIEFTGSGDASLDAGTLTNGAEGSITGVKSVTVTGGGSNAGQIGGGSGSGSGSLESFTVGADSGSAGSDNFTNTGSIVTEELTVKASGGFTNGDASGSGSGSVTGLDKVTVEGSLTNSGKMDFSGGSSTGGNTFTVTDTGSATNGKGGSVTGLESLVVGGTPAGTSGTPSFTNEGEVSTDNVTVGSNGTVTNGQDGSLTIGEGLTGSGKLINSGNLTAGEGSSVSGFTGSFEQTGGTADFTGSTGGFIGGEVSVTGGELKANTLEGTSGVTIGSGTDSGGNTTTGTVTVPTTGAGTNIDINGGKLVVTGTAPEGGIPGTSHITINDGTIETDSGNLFDFTEGTGSGEGSATFKSNITSGTCSSSSCSGKSFVLTDESLDSGDLTKVQKLLGIGTSGGNGLTVSGTVTDTTTDESGNKVTTAKVYDIAQDTKYQIDDTSSATGKSTVYLNTQLAGNKAVMKKAAATDPDDPEGNTLFIGTSRITDAQASSNLADYNGQSEDGKLYQHLNDMGFAALDLNGESNKIFVTGEKELTLYGAGGSESLIANAQNGVDPVVYVGNTEKVGDNETTGVLNLGSASAVRGGTLEGTVKVRSDGQVNVQGTGTFTVKTIKGDQGAQINVGSEESTGQLVVKNLELAGGTLFIDPAWSQDASRVAVGSTTVTKTDGTGALSETLTNYVGGSIYVGQNSQLVLGDTSTGALTTALTKLAASSAASSLSFGQGQREAAVYLAGAVTVAQGAVLYVDGTLEGSVSNASVTLTNGGVYLAADSLLIVNSTGLTGAAITAEDASMEFKVASGAKIVIDNAVLVADTDITVAEGFAAIDTAAFASDGDTYAIANNLLLTATRKTEGVDAGSLVLTVSRDQQAVEIFRSTSIAGNTVYDIIGQSVSEGDAAKLAYDRISAILNPANGNFDAATAAADVNRIALMNAGAGVKIAAMNASSTVVDSIESQLSAGKLERGQKGTNAWVTLNGTSSRAHGLEAGVTTYGFKSELAGLTLGGDYAFGNGVTAGAAFSAGSGSVRGQGSASDTKNSVDYWGVNAYGIWETPYADVIGSIGYLEGSSEVSQSGYSSKPDAKAISLALRVEKDLTSGSTPMVLKPHAGLRYTRVKSDNFTAGGFEYKSDSVNVVELPVGVELSGKVKTAKGAVVKPMLDFTVTGNLSGRKADNVFKAQGLTSSDTFSTEFTGPVSFGVKAGFGIEKSAHRLDLDVGIKAGSHRTDQHLKARYTYSF